MERRPGSGIAKAVNNVHTAGERVGVKCDRMLITTDTSTILSSAGDRPMFGDVVLSSILPNGTSGVPQLSATSPLSPFPANFAN
jgi:hypothetical protein